MSATSATTATDLILWQLWHFFAYTPCIFDSFVYNSIIEHMFF